MESEGFDRKHMRLPDNQNDLIEALVQLNKPMTVVLFAGSPVEMAWAKDVQSILCMHTGGQAVAEAVVRLLLGEANPCGKLAESYPLFGSHAPCALTYPQREEAIYSEGVFVGYRYYEKKQLPVRYAFGHGLSYTQFSYADLRLDRDAMLEFQRHQHRQTRGQGDRAGLCAGRFLQRAASGEGTEGIRQG